MRSSLIWVCTVCSDLPVPIFKIITVYVSLNFQAHDQKKQYKGLKNEVVGSQKMVYFSQQGFVRPRPVTAPNLTQYKNMEEEIKRKQSIAAHNALFNKYQKILKKAHKKDKGE